MVAVPLRSSFRFDLEQRQSPRSDMVLCSCRRRPTTNARTAFAAGRCRRPTAADAAQTPASQGERFNLLIARDWCARLRFAPTAATPPLSLRTSRPSRTANSLSNSCHGLSTELSEAAAYTSPAPLQHAAQESEARTGDASTKVVATDACAPRPEAHHAKRPQRQCRPCRPSPCR